MAKYSGNPHAAFVGMVLQDLDKINDERDRDECEILITKPDFQELTDESHIPAYQGLTVTHQHHPIMQANTTTSMTTRMVTCNTLANVLREELVKDLYKRPKIRNSISQIILDFLTTGKCSTDTLPDTNVSSYAHEVEDDEDSRLVDFWTSKIVKLDDDVINRIKKYLFPLRTL
ncbi:uncharacterized protein LOC105447137 [Strongylocentrotus purpuratus]|uniref:Uncharacterized protein n=1 Tax=Strongylocentrotus purpuratus TaxID=7668 RepID=A0A7M7NG40_STRPU|nr:uncharacterized protein LOC105447137 [Strongylocentrotus purpuratus]